MYIYFLIRITCIRQDIIFYMFQTIVERILSRILGQYVQGFSSENLKIGLWSGQVVIKNVALKKEIIKKLNLPFKLLYSRLGCLRMSIPWSSLASSKIDVVVEGLEILISEVPEKYWECKNNKIIEKRKEEIQSFCDTIIKDFTEKAAKNAKEKQEEGYFSKMIVKIIDNIQVTVKDIHVRYEDQITQKYSFGVTLQELKIYTVNKLGEAEFIDRTRPEYRNQPLRKNLILSNLGIYWNQNSQFFPKQNMHELMLNSIAKKGSLDKFKFNHVILMSFDARLYQREAGKQFSNPEIEVDIGFESLRIQISNGQLQQIVTLSERLQKYTNQVKAQNRKKLSQLQMIANRQIFLQIFPKYFEKTITPDELNKFESILEKMQVSIFTDGMKKYLQGKQKQKMIKEKKQKSRGWFSGPKELTEKEKEQIEKFVHDNFGAPVIIVQRPEDFYYIQVNFVLKKLQIVIANNNELKRQKDGIRAIFSEIRTDFNLREGGHLLNFGIESFKVQMFRRKFHTEVEEVTNIVQKLSEEVKELENKQYVSLKVLGNPLDKKHIDTEIILKTDELLIFFDPRIIKVAQQFADIKVSSQNTEAAFEAYGDLKNKTTSLAADTFETHQKKNFLSIDAQISAMNLILFFDPSKTDGDIWAVSLGNIQIFTDPDTLLKPEFAPNQAMQKYAMKFLNISMAHHENKQKFLTMKAKNTQIKKTSKLLNDLNVDFELEIFQRATDFIPKMKARAIMHTVDLGICDFTYKKIQKIGDCFAMPVPASQQSMIQTKQKQDQKVKQKSEVMKGAKKIGILWEQSKDLEKYIAVLSGGYLYLYKDKKDVHYSKYYYVKNASCKILDEQDPNKKSYGMIVENSVNKLQLGFEKSQVMKDWIEILRELDREDYKIIEDTEQKEKTAEKQKKFLPNLLNFEVEAKIQLINITTMLSNEKYIAISVSELGTHMYLHEAKIILDVSLKGIQLKDNIYYYKYPELSNFLYSESIEQSNKLIDIKIQQLSDKHPDYSFVDSTIDVNFGKLICNYKPETVESVMLFFLPRPDEKAKVEKKQVESGKKNVAEENEKNRRKALQILCEIIKNEPQKWAMKVNLNISEISVSLVNRKNRVMFGKLGLTGFKLLFGQSTRKMLLQGGLEEMWFIDYSNYPYTIIEEQEKYENIDYFLQSDKKDKDMMEFDIKLLETPNSDGKNLLIYTKINDLKVSYVQQPVLRILSYLTEQMLPSLTPDGQDASQPKKPPPINDSKPLKGTMELKTELENIVVYISPRTKQQKREYLQVNVKYIDVKNSAIYRPFIKTGNPKNQDECVLVENYTILMKGINITEMFLQKQTKLTNDIDFDVSCDLTQNSMYYHKTFKEKYDAGMRIDCHMAPFLMKINHDDYNFMMKCLFWCISYDDNAEGYMFDGTPQQTNEKGEIATSDPMYFRLVMDKIALCVTENNLPISVLNLNAMTYNLTLNEKGMIMDLTMKNLFGTNIHQTNDPNISKQLGLFNAFGHQKELNTKQLYDIDSLVKLVSRNDMVYKDKGTPVIYYYMEMPKNGDMIIDMKIEALKISIQLRNLLILSKLALMEESIQPPKPTLEPKNKKLPPPSQGGKMQITFQMNDFLGSLSDASNTNFVVMEGEIIAKILTYPRKPDDQVLRIAHKYASDYTMELADNVFEVRNFSFYFCNIKQLKNRRYIMQPMNLFFKMKQFFSKKEEDVINNTQIYSNIDKIIIESSIRDLLKISAIAQDNLAKLSDSGAKQKKEEISEKESVATADDISKIIVEKEADLSLVQEKLKVIEKKIIPKTKAELTMEPILMRIVNDCDNNFMPVISFVIQQSKVFFRSDAIKSHLSQQNFTMKMDFFNPRSSDWQPVMESFRFSLDFLTLINEFGQESKIIINSSEIEELSEIKLNISTQFVKSLKATMDIASIQQKKLKEQKLVDQFEVSPYIIQNLTYGEVIIHRIINGEQTEYRMPPLFKGPVRLNQKAEKIDFTLMKLRYSFPLDKFGVNRIPGKPGYYMDFSVDELNRVIKFVNGSLIKNSTGVPLYCLRYDKIPKPIDKEKILINPGEVLPVKKHGFIQLSLNGNTYTHMTQVSNMEVIQQIKAESQKFKLSVSHFRSSLKHSVFSIWPPLIITNCLPKDIKIQFILKGKTASTKQIKALENHEVFANEQIYSMRFKIIVDGFYWSQEFGTNPAMFGKQQQLYLSDREEGGTTLKFIIQKKQTKNMFNFNIFCAAYIISELDYDIQIYGNLQNDETNKSIEKYYLLGGQSEYWKQDKTKAHDDKAIDKITFIGAQTGSKLRICGKGCLVDFSQPITINGIGLVESRIVVEKQSRGKKTSLFTNVGADISLKKMGKKSEIFSREIIIRSRSIIVNETNYDFEIKEEGGQKYFFNIPKKQKKPFYFTMPELKERPRGIVFRTSVTIDSLPIMSNGLGTVFFRMQQLKQSNKFIYFKLMIEQIKSYIFYIIHEVDEEHLPYQVIVKSPKLEVNVPFYQRVVRKNSPPLMFINERADPSLELYLQIRAIGGSKFQEMNVQVDNLKFNKSFNYYQDGVTQMFISVFVSVIFDDNKKFIVIGEVYNREEKTKEFVLQTMNVKINKIAFSFISNHNQLDVCRPYEPFVFSLMNLQFYSEKTNKRTKYQSRLQFLQFDQNQPFNLPNPVIITPYRYKQFVEENSKTKKTKAIFNSLIQIDNSFVKNTLINKVIIDIEDLVLHADTQFIKMVLMTTKDFLQAMNASEKQNKIERQVNPWENIEIPKEGRKTFIKQIKLAPFTIQISAELRLNELDTESVIFFGTIINALGVVITNIEGAPIIFDGIQINDCVDTVDGLNKKLMEHYKGSVLGQLYKVFGSLNIIGNPVSLFRNVSTGFKDLKDKPAQGFVEGPLQFGKGLAQGTSSLIAHSVGGALNSVEKITGTIGSGLAVLTFDKEFEEMREKQKMKKPKHVFEGLEKGGKAVFHGFKEGITGVFTKPYQNTKKEGVIGFFKGTAQGVAGLVVKPVTGVVDFASQTTQGLKNTALYLEDKPNQNRMRYPRVFYTQLSNVREYNPIDSKLYAIINKTKYEDKYGFENTLFIQSFIINESCFLLVLMEDIIFIRIDDEAIEWAVPIEDCEVKSESNGVRVYAKTKRQWYTKKVDEKIVFRDKNSQKEFQAMIQELKASMKDKAAQIKVADD